MPENRKLMTREEFLLEIDEILGLRAGTLRGDERLEELENWRKDGPSSTIGASSCLQLFSSSLECDLVIGIGGRR